MIHLLFHPDEAVGGAATATDTPKSEEVAEEPAKGADEDTSEEEPAAVGGSETSTEEDTTTEGDAETSPSLEDLDDETVGDFISVYRDRILGDPSITEATTRLVKQEVDRQVSGQLRGKEAQSETESLVTRGRTAVNSLLSGMQGVQDTLDKASKGESFSANVFDKDKYLTQLKDYGDAIVADTRQGTVQRFDSAIEQGFNRVLREEVGELNKDQVTELEGIVSVHETARRGTPEQAEQAESVFVRGLIDFVTARAHDKGMVDERERVRKGKTVTEKIAGTNAVKAAKAKLEKEKNPPRTPGSSPRSNDATLKSYEEARDAGEHELADQISLEMTRLGRNGT